MTEEETMFDKVVDEQQQSRLVKNRKGRRVARLDLSCPLCPTITKGTNSLNHHCQVKHKKFRCSFCGDLFDTENEQQRHKHSAHSYTCWCCQSLFLTEGLLVAHFKEIHPNEKPFKCSMCNRCYMANKLLQSHLVTHERARRFICEVCGKVFKSSSNLGQHKAVHLESSQKYSHTCVECGKGFTVGSRLKYHMRRHTGEKTFKCKFCIKAFWSNENLKLHELVHSAEKKFACENCGVAYRHLRNLENHKRTKHTGGYSYKCMVCPNIYASETEVLNHFKLHSEEEKVNVTIMGDTVFVKTSDFKCDTCGNYYMNKFTLARHVKYAHSASAENGDVTRPLNESDGRTGMKLQFVARNFTSEGKNFICEICGTCMSTRTSLSIHKRTKHLEKRPYICDICGKGFIFRSVLIEHIRTHTGEMPYECNVCGKHFARSSSLNLHKKRVHLNLRPLKCRFCNKAFKVHSARTVHERIHTGVRPYECDICHQTFIQKPDMTRHRQRHIERDSLMEENSPADDGASKLIKVPAKLIKKFETRSNESDDSAEFVAKTFSVVYDEATIIEQSNDFEVVVFQQL
jgi:KRAB domain-containing zinc finger protein